jgi:palmitoyltransferase
MPSNAHKAQHLRSRKRGAAEISTVPPYHPDYEPAQHEYGDNDEDDYDDGEQFAEFEMGRRAAHVRHGSEGYEVRSIDREQLLAEYISTRGQEAGHYQRYVPEPPSDPESGGEGEEEVEVREVYHDGDDLDRDDEEPLSVRVEKWRSGEAIS